MKDIIANTVKVAVSYAIGSFIVILLIMSAVWGNGMTMQGIVKTWACGMLIAGILIIIADIVTIMSNILRRG